MLPLIEQLRIYSTKKAKSGEENAAKKRLTSGELITVPSNFLVDKEWCCETKNWPWA